MTENKNFNREQQGPQQYGKEHVEGNKQQPRKQEDKNLRQTQGGSGCKSCDQAKNKNPQDNRPGSNQPRR